MTTVQLLILVVGAVLALSIAASVHAERARARVEEARTRRRELDDEASRTDPGVSETHR